MASRKTRFHGLDSDWRQEVAQHLSNVLAWTLQRTPFATHFAVTLLGILGPLLAPRLVSIVTIAIHVVFILCQTRLALAMYWCYRGVYEHSMTDWTEVYERERSEVEKKVGTLYTLDWRAVQHCILVPAYKEDVSTLKEVSGWVSALCCATARQKSHPSSNCVLVPLADARYLGFTPDGVDQLQHLPRYGGA